MALGCMWVDTTLPTDEDLHARRPHLILRNKHTKDILILDVARAWELLIQEQEKIGKYPPLAADIGKKEPQWHVQVRVQVVGPLEPWYP